MKQIKLFISVLSLFFFGLFSNVEAQSIPIKFIVEKNAPEKFVITFPQKSLLHGDGGWEKDPSSWYSSKSAPVEYRAGILLMNHGKIGYIKHVLLTLKFAQPGSIEVSANTDPNAKIGSNGWQRVYGDPGKLEGANIIIRDYNFDRTVTVYLRDFKPFYRQPVN